MIKVHSCLTVRCCRTETIRSIALVSTLYFLTNGNAELFFHKE